MLSEDIGALPPLPPSPPIGSEDREVESESPSSANLDAASAHSPKSSSGPGKEHSLSAVGSAPDPPTPPLARRLFPRRLYEDDEAGAELESVSIHIPIREDGDAAADPPPPLRRSSFHSSAHSLTADPDTQLGYYQAGWRAAQEEIGLLRAQVQAAIAQVRGSVEVQRELVLLVEQQDADKAAWREQEQAWDAARRAWEADRQAWQRERSGWDAERARLARELDETRTQLAEQERLLSALNPSELAQLVDGLRLEREDMDNRQRSFLLFLEAQRAHGLFRHFPELEALARFSAGFPHPALAPAPAILSNRKGLLAQAEWAQAAAAQNSGRGSHVG